MLHSFWIQFWQFAQSLVSAERPSYTPCTGWVPGNFSRWTNSTLFQAEPEVGAYCASYHLLFCNNMIRLQGPHHVEKSYVTPNASQETGMLCVHFFSGLGNSRSYRMEDSPGVRKECSSNSGSCRKVYRRTSVSPTCRAVPSTLPQSAIDGQATNSSTDDIKLCSGKKFQKKKAV